MNLREIGTRRIVLAGVILGAALGGTIATVIDGMSGPTFWAGIAVGAVVGSIILVAGYSLFGFLQAVRQRTSHRT